MTVLAITNKPLNTSSNGYDLRVARLCQALAQHEKIILLTVLIAPVDITDHDDIDTETIFSEVLATVPLTSLQPSFMRHFRLNEENFFKWGYPEFEKTVVHQIDAICNQYDIHKIVVFGSNLAGLLKPFSGKKKLLLDVCDSVVLTMEREMLLANSQCKAAWLERAKKSLTYKRWRALEAKTPVWFDHVMTINHKDTETIRRISNRGKNLSTIPNGVDTALEQAYQEGSRLRRGVAFWGTLSFPPNKDAVSFFYSNVYLPYLKPAGIELCIVGRDAEPWLLEAAKQDPNIRLTGFVQDLRQVLAEYPIMVNPMRIGSGMKNKVLEAYAIGLAVISTPLGIESIEGATAGESYLEAKTPSDFFNAIQSLLANEERRLIILRAARQILMKKYTWNIVGAQWTDLVNRI